MKEYEFESKIMGCDAAISIVTASERAANEVHARMIDIANKEEERFSRFMDESELSQLHIVRHREVSPLFMETFLYSKELYKRTRGAFNPLVDISRYGYDEDIEVVRGADRTGSPVAPYNIAMEDVAADETTRTITLQEGQKLDFGGFLKGHVAQKMALEANGCDGVIVSLGGDLFTYGHDANDAPFEFCIDMPHEGMQPLFFTAANVGIATSGTYARTWTLNGKPFSHVLDGTGTKNPESDIVSATVVAPTGREAEGFSTAALVLGSEAGASLVREQGFSYVFILNDGRVVHSSGFPFTSGPHS